MPNDIALDDFSSGTNITDKMSTLLIDKDTLGPIEGKTNKINVFKRVVFGFRSFKNFRLRILLSSQATTLNIKEKMRKKITAKQIVLQTD